MVVDIIYYLKFVEEFLQVSNQQCLVEGYIQYGTLNEALLHCISNTRCAGIRDGSCDNEGDFYVCLDGIRSDDNQISGCVYKKSEYHGKYTKSFKALYQG